MSTGGPAAGDGAPVDDEERRRLRERVFGEVLPETTSDERDGSSVESGGNEDWLRSNVPPHHG